MSEARSRRTSPGRPVVTSHREIEEAAFALFADRGFDGTTMEMIAMRVGVGRRTLFRYYESKNDIAWGRFEVALTEFRRVLAALPTDLPIHEALHRGIVAFNTYPPEQQAQHRQRMCLILQTPSLRAHSTLPHARWRAVVADFVAARTGAAPTDLGPRTVAQVSLALSLTAYETWLAHLDRSVEQCLDDTLAALREHLRQ